MKSILLLVLLCQLGAFGQVRFFDESINSPFDESHPLISPDGKDLYFIRTGHPENTYFKEMPNCQEIWHSELKSDGSWSKAIHMPPPFNMTSYNTIFSITPDGTTIMIRNAYKNGQAINQGFSISHRTNEGWSQFEMLQIKNFSRMSKGIYNGGFLSNDRNVLILYFSKIFQSEESDLYVSLPDKTGKWTRPYKLSINTKYDEHSPFLASDGKTLYFSSNRPGGQGGKDIYLTRRLDDSWKKWSEPENLGKIINTEKDESSYSLDAKGEYAYIITNRIENKGTDIIAIKLNDEIKPNPVVLITGRVINSKTLEPLEASIHYEKLEENSESDIAQSNPVDGEYKIILPYGKNYGLLAKVSGFISLSDNLDLTEVAGYTELKRDLYLTPIEVGQTIRLNNLFFDFGKASLRSESYSELDRLVDLLNDNPKMQIEISGHTDNVGSDDANMKLSSDRAKSVKNYLVTNGVITQRVTVKGYGETNPTVPNNTEEGKQLNRRVDFTILQN